MKNKQNKANRNIRIIGGKFKGRKIQVVQNVNLRPTTNIARERLFNWLNSFIAEAKCLDCFAGTGALGIEALSRNASYVTFIEKNTSISKQLHKNLNILKIKNAEIFTTNYKKWIRKIQNDYKIIFLDPPFKENIIDLHIKLFKECTFSSNTLIYIESKTKNNTIELPNNWTLYKEKISKNVSYRLYIKK